MGHVEVPKEQLYEFKAALFDLKFDKLDDENEDENDDIDEAVPSKVTKMETNTPEQSTTPKKSTVPTETPNVNGTDPSTTKPIVNGLNGHNTVIKEEIDQKPTLPLQNGSSTNFINTVLQKSKETLIPDFSSNSPNALQSPTLRSTPTFKPTFVPPPLNIASPKQKVTLGILGMYWVKLSQNGLKPQDAPKDCKHFFICTNENEAFISFQTELEALEFLKTHKASSIQDLPTALLSKSDSQKIENELSARPRIHVCIHNFTKLEYETSHENV